MAQRQNFRRGISLGGASVVDFVYVNRWLHWFLFAPLTRFGATIYVKDNCVCDRSVGMFTTAGGFTGVLVTEFRERPFLRPFTSVLNPVKVLVTMDARATPPERTAAYSINLDCLTKLRGCRDTREMDPAIWQNSCEVAPTVWKSQWDE